MKKEAQIFIGPMSKNIVDAICETSIRNRIRLGLIPSRRQVEYDGGYVNGWNTKTFIQHVDSKEANIITQRDHGGPLQGSTEDDGKKSLETDCTSGFDLVHIDPWKKHKRVEDAAAATVECIRYCYKINTDVGYEVGTEAAIREYSAAEFRQFLESVESELGAEFEKIKYGVIQGGTAIVGNKNVGTFNSDRCTEMVSICKSFGLLSKEHNGDYLYGGQIKKRFDCGLDAINIAPEFGFIETNVILNEIINNLDSASYDAFYKACYESKKWVKWLPPGVEKAPEDIRKLAILRTSGHYVFNTKAMGQIKKRYPDLDIKIKNAITSRLMEILNEITRF
jgi:D-tagatose-1,6-bisphosphate aldolase subunit GatZ/KbaZ